MIKPMAWICVWVAVAGLLVGCEDDAPRGALEFRIVPYRPEVEGGGNSVSAETRDEYVVLLRAHGFEHVLDRDGDYVWMPVQGVQRFPQCVTAEHEGRLFLLVDNRSGHVMLSDLSRKGWRITSVEEGIGPLDRHAIEFHFDEAGAEKMAQLTVAHRGDHLAIIVHGEVCSAFEIRDIIGSEVHITTPDADQAEAIVRGLREGLPAAR